MKQSVGKGPSIKHTRSVQPKMPIGIAYFAQFEFEFLPRFPVWTNAYLLTDTGLEHLIYASFWRETQTSAGK